jgi:hypothetical protein
LIRAVFARRGVGAFAQQGTSESRSDQVPDDTVNPLGGPKRLIHFDNTKPYSAYIPTRVLKCLSKKQIKTQGMLQFLYLISMENK